MIMEIIFGLLTSILVEFWCTCEKGCISRLLGATITSTTTMKFQIKLVLVLVQVLVVIVVLLILLIPEIVIRLDVCFHPRYPYEDYISMESKKILGQKKEWKYNGKVRTYTKNMEKS